MQTRHELHHHIETALDHSTETVLPPLHYQWPQLGQELFVQEETLTEGGTSPTTTSDDSQQTLREQEKKQKREKLRNTIIAQLYRDDEGHSLDTRHLAFLLVRLGRGGELVGNPSAIEQDGKHELPYTGLEGYYAGSERTSQRPGITREAIIQEEANLGAEVLKSLKKRAIANYSWADFARLLHILAGQQQPSIEDLKTLQFLWTETVRRLHVRVYHNLEFEPTLTENIEQLEHLLFCSSFTTEQEKKTQKVLEDDYHRLRKEYNHLSTTEQEQERQERQRRVRIRADRLEEFHQFRKATYEMLAVSGQGRYAVGVQDTSLKDATITEAIALPDLPDRSSYPPTLVHLAPEQLEGYLFLAHLGEVGGDPLVRSELVSEYPSY
jgi:hypothetical protein